MGKARNVRIAGVGSFLPPYYTTTEEVAQALPGTWPADVVAQKIGVKSRYFLHELDVERGKTRINMSRHSNDMALVACRHALKMAGVDANQVDGIVHVTCTPDEAYFSWPAIGLARSLQLRQDAYAEHLPSGCGGFMAALLGVKERIMGSEGRRARVLLAASNYPSAFFDREAYLARDDMEHPIPSWLSLQLFGDAAAAFLLEATDDPDQGILQSVVKWMPDELVRNRGGGAKYPANRCEPWRNTYYIEGRLVEQRYKEFMRSVIPELLQLGGVEMTDIERFYLHPANRRLVEEVMTEINLPIHLAPINVDVIGNVSAAATPYLLDVDLEQGKIALGSGKLAVFAALGAGVHAGGHLIRL